MADFLAYALRKTESGRWKYGNFRNNTLLGGRAGGGWVGGVAAGAGAAGGRARGVNSEGSAFGVRCETHTRQTLESGHVVEATGEEGVGGGGGGGGRGRGGGGLSVDAGSTALATNRAAGAFCR